MRRSRLPVFCLLLLASLGAADGAEPRYVAEEIPLPFDGTAPWVRIGADGTASGCAERGPGDWLPFVWHPSTGLVLIDGGGIGPEYSCSVWGGSDGVVAGHALVPAAWWPYATPVPFVWTPRRGVEQFNDIWWGELNLSRSGQLVIVEYGSRMIVWTEAEGRFDVDLDDGSIVSFRQSAAGTIAGVLEYGSERTLFVWSRERGLETFAEHPYDPWNYDQVVGTVERLSDDGWTAGYLPDTEPPYERDAYVRAPDGTMHVLSTGGGVELGQFGEDGVILGTMYAEPSRTSPFVFQPGFGVETLSLSSGEYGWNDRASDVNASDVVVGTLTEDNRSYPFVWQRGKGIERIDLGGWYDAAWAITDGGQVLGEHVDLVDFQWRRRPFLWSAATGPVLLQWEENQGETRTTGFNEHGTVIGRADAATGFDARPFIYDVRNGLLDPRDWLPPLAEGSVWPSQLQASGRMLIEAAALDDGRRRLFVLSPVGGSGGDVSGRRD